MNVPRDEPELNTIRSNSFEFIYSGKKRSTERARAHNNCTCSVTIARADTVIKVVCWSCDAPDRFMVIKILVLLCLLYSSKNLLGIY